MSVQCHLHHFGIKALAAFMMCFSHAIRASHVHTPHLVVVQAMDPGEFGVERALHLYVPYRRRSIEQYQGVFNQKERGLQSRKFGFHQLLVRDKPRNLEMSSITQGLPITSMLILYATRYLTCILSLTVGLY